MDSLSSTQQALVFKKLFHKSKKAIYLAVGKDEKGKDKVKKLYGSLKKHRSTLKELNQKGSDIFMLINTASGENRQSDQITDVNAFFIDYDGGDWSAEDITFFLEKFPVKPDLVVETSPGCFHAYWPVAGVPLKEFKSIQQQLAQKFGSDKQVCDLPRVMRMPGTINHKREEPFTAHIVHVQRDATPIPYLKFKTEMFGAEERTVTAEKIEAAKKQTSVNARSRNKTERVLQALQSIPPIDRKIWVSVGMALKADFGDSGLQMFKNWSSGSSKYDEQELERQWKSFKSEGGITVRTLYWLANSYSKPFDANETKIAAAMNLLVVAQCFAEASTDSIRYCEKENGWYRFTNGKWGRSAKGAERIAIDYLRKMDEVAAKSKNDAFRNFVTRNQTHASARELLRLAESDHVLSVDSSDFDRAPNVIGVKLKDVPGAIDCYALVALDQNKMKLAEPKDMVLNVLGATFDGSATCPLWEKFIQDITEGDIDLIKFMQEAVGYTLYGHTKEQVMFVLIGSGGNGKGVFTRIILRLFGEYAAIMQSNLLKPGAISANNPSPALMKLRSKRFWACSEMPKGMVLDEAITKQITGGDLVSSRQLYGDQVEFLPVGKLWLSVNNMPRVRHDDKGMWRRVLPVPFNAVFTGKDRDNDLEDKLLAELSGILNWALEGARRYAAKGKLEWPAASKKLLAALRRDVDTVGLWIKSRCATLEEGKIQSKVAYDDYCDAMKMERVTPLPQKEFKADLISRGHGHKNGRSYNYFQGLAIINAG